jgi:hypothetical protein
MRQRKSQPSCEAIFVESCQLSGSLLVYCNGLISKENLPLYAHVWSDMSCTRHTEGPLTARAWLAFLSRSIMLICTVTIDHQVICFEDSQPSSRCTWGWGSRPCNDGNARILCCAVVLRKCLEVIRSCFLAAGRPSSLSRRDLTTLLNAVLLISLHLSY